MAGIIYVLVNQAMPGLIKIGRTTDVEIRMRQLDSSGVPLPFECFYAAEVADPDQVEHALHDAFEDHRVRRNREFFRLSPDKPKVIIRLMALKEVTPRTDIVTDPGDQEALDQARRRHSRFHFSSVGIKVGAELHSTFDDAVTCIVKDDTSVTFRGEEHSLSRSALIVAKENGYDWTSIAGPVYWKYEGKTLSELREESDDLPDEPGPT
jgi:T5orf172 domain